MPRAALQLRVLPQPSRQLTSGLTPPAGSGRRAQRTYDPHAQRPRAPALCPQEGATSRAIPSTSRDTSRQYPRGPPRPTHRVRAGVTAASPLLSAAWCAARPQGARWSRASGANLARPQAPPRSAPPHPTPPGLGIKAAARGYVVSPSARAGERERQRGCQVSARRRVGVGGGPVDRGRSD